MLPMVAQQFQGQLCARRTVNGASFLFCNALYTIRSEVSRSFKSPASEPQIGLVAAGQRPIKPKVLTSEQKCKNGYVLSRYRM